jgi:hypothetical protein
MKADRQQIIVLTTTGDRIRLSCASRAKAKQRGMNILRNGCLSTKAGVLRLYPASSIRTVKIIPATK